jgi:hypothetical protein
MQDLWSDRRDGPIFPSTATRVTSECQVGTVVPSNQGSCHTLQDGSKITQMLVN